MDLSIEEEADINGLTTTVQGRRAFVADTPTPMVNMILRSMTAQPQWHTSWKQSKN
jgi:hypothetical protein